MLLFCWKMRRIMCINQLSKLMRLWHLSHRRPAEAHARLRIRAFSPEPSLFAHMKYGSRRRVRPNIRHLAPTGWLRMRVWRMSLPRTKSAIISWAGSIIPRADIYDWVPFSCCPYTLYMKGVDLWTFGRTSVPKSMPTRTPLPPPPAHTHISRIRLCFERLILLIAICWMIAFKMEEQNHLI